MSESTTLPRLSLITALLLSLFTTHAQVQSLVNRDWVTTGGTPNGLYDFQASHVDVSGNIVVVGNTFHYGQAENYLISKYGAGGDLQFRREYDGLASSTDFATDVTSEGKNTYVTGVEGDTVAGTSYITTQKLDSVGNVVWTERYQNSYKKYNLGFRIIADPSGTSLYVCGTSQTTPTDFALTVIKYSTAGTQAWVATYDSVGLYDAAVDMKVSGTNLIVYGISGVSSTSGDFITRSYSTSSGSLTGQSRVSASGAYIAKPIGIAKDHSENIYFTGVVKNGTTGSDIQIVKLDSTLTLKWAKTIDGGYSKNDEVAAIKVDSRNNIILTGFAANADTSKAIWTIKMKDSVIVWSKKYICPIAGKDAKGYDVDLDAFNNIYVTGSNYSGVYQKQLSISYDSSGNERWEKSFSDTTISNDIGRNIKIDSGGNIYVYGKSQIGTSYTYTTQKYEQWSSAACTGRSSICPDITYSFHNGKITTSGIDSFLEFDIYALQNTPSLTYSGSDIIFTYSNAIFGYNAVDSGRVTVTSGTITSNTNYTLLAKDTLFPSDILSSNCKEIKLSIRAISSSPLYTILDTATQLCHIKMKLKKTGNYQIAFDQFFMENRSTYYSGSYLLYNYVIATGVFELSGSCSTPTLTYSISNIRCSANGYTFDVVYKCTLSVPIADMGFIISWDNTQANYAADVSATWWPDVYASGANPGAAIYPLTTDINFVNTGLGYLQMQANTDADYDPTDANVQRTASTPTTEVRYGNVGLSFVAGVTNPTPISFAMNFNTTPLGIGGMLVANDYGCGDVNDGVTTPAFSVVANKTDETFQIECDDAIKSLNSKVGSVTVFPNPFSSNLWLQYQLSEETSVSLQIIDLLGREIYNANEGNISLGTHLLWCTPFLGQ
jgi:hypothetical protein